MADQHTDPPAWLAVVEHHREQAARMIALAGRYSPGSQTAGTYATLAVAHALLATGQMTGEAAAEFKARTDTATEQTQ